VHDVLLWIETTAVATWVRESGSLWAYPLVLTAHTLGMSVLVGASAVLDLRVLGAAPGLPLAPLSALFRGVWAGALLSGVSGLLLFTADASTKGATPVFFVKLACIAAGLVVARSLHRHWPHDGAAAGAARPARARGLAVMSLVCWTAAIAAGRFMAYLTPAPF